MANDSARKETTKFLIIHFTGVISQESNELTTKDASITQKAVHRNHKRKIVNIQSSIEEIFVFAGRLFFLFAIICFEIKVLVEVRIFSKSKSINHRSFPLR